MKKPINGVILLIGTLFLSACFGPSISEEGRSYDTAKIEYQWSGIVEGTEVFYAKGNKRRSEINTVTKVSGGESRQNMLIINDGEYTYNIDLNSKLALKQDNPYKEEIKTKTPEELQLLRKKLALYLKETDTIPAAVGKEQVAGKDCDLYDLGNSTKKCLWEEQVLKTELIIDSGKASQVAQKIEVDQELDDSLFTLPEGITVEDLSK